MNNYIEKYVDDPYKGVLSDSEIEEYNILKQIYFLEIAKGKTNDTFPLWIMKNKNRLDKTINEMRMLKGKKMMEEKSQKTISLAKYLDDMMTTSSIGLTPSNYVGTMRKYNRKSKKGEYVGGAHGEAAKIQTKNPDGSFKTGAPDPDPKTIISKKKYVDPLIAMKANLKKAKSNKGLSMGLQSRSIIL